MKKLRKANRIAMTKINLNKLTRPQLIALGKQKTDIPYQELLFSSKDLLVTRLAEVKNVLAPEEA